MTNARIASLAATAPEMLAALKGIEPLVCEWLEAIDGEWGLCRELPKLIEAKVYGVSELLAVRAAIAKAEGRST